jgi:hypothetical protein
MTERNRECKVQVQALARVCTYSGITCTCTNPARRAVTIGDNLESASVGHRES